MMFMLNRLITQRSISYHSKYSNRYHRIIFIYKSLWNVSDRFYGFVVFFVFVGLDLFSRLDNREKEKSQRRSKLSLSRERERAE